MMGAQQIVSVRPAKVPTLRARQARGYWSEISPVPIALIPAPANQSWLQGLCVSASNHSLCTYYPEGGKP
jgi:hypothetical protein